MTWRLEPDASGFLVRRSVGVAEPYKAAGYWRDETLADVARARTREDASRTVLIEGDRRITRGEAWEQARRLAAFFASRGLGPGDVVSFQLPNWIDEQARDGNTTSFSPASEGGRARCGSGSRRACPRGRPRHHAGAPVNVRALADGTHSAAGSAAARYCLVNANV